MPGRDYTQAYIRLERALHNGGVPEDFDVSPAASTPREGTSFYQADDSSEHSQADDEPLPSRHEPFITFGLQDLDRAGLPPTPPSQVHLNDPILTSRMDSNDSLKYDKHAVALSTSSNGPLTPEVTPPTTSYGLSTEPRDLKPKPSVGAESIGSFMTAKEDQWSSVPDDSRIQLPIEGVSDEPSSTQSDPLEKPRAFSLVDGGLDASYASINVPYSSVTHSSNTQDFVAGDLTHSQRPAATSLEGQSSKADVERDFASNQAPCTWFDDDSLHRSTPIKLSQSVLATAVNVESPLDSVMTVTPERRLSAASNASTVVQAKSRGGTPERKRTLRRMGPKSELRKASMDDESASRGSWFLSEFESSDSIVNGKYVSPSASRPSTRGELFDIPRQSSAQRLSSDPRTDENNAAQDSAAAIPRVTVISRPGATHSSAPREERAYRLARFGQRAVSDPLASEKVPSGAHGLHTTRPEPVEPQQQQQQQQQQGAVPSSRIDIPNKRLEEQPKTSSVKTVKTVKTVEELDHLRGPDSLDRSSLVADGTSRTSADYWTDSLRGSHMRMTGSPFSLRSDLEITEAKVVNIYSHNNNSVVVVEHTPSQSSSNSCSAIPQQNAMSRDAMTTPPRETITVDSPLQNPRKPPAPPTFSVVHPTPSNEAEGTSPSRRTSLKRAARTYSDSILAPFLAPRNPIDGSRKHGYLSPSSQTKTGHSQVCTTAGSTKASSQRSRRPQSTLDNYTDSEADLLSDAKLKTRPHSTGDLLSAVEQSTARPDMIQRRSTLRIVRDFAFSNDGPVRRRLRKPAPSAYSPSVSGAWVPAPPSPAKVSQTSLSFSGLSRSGSLYGSLKNKMRESSLKREDKRREEQREKLRNSIGTRLFHDTNVRADVE